MEYKLEKNVIDIRNNNLIGYGKKGNVYKFKRNALKIFPKGNIPNDVIDLNTCSRLCDISTDCILLPRKIVYYKNNTYSGYALKLINKSIRKKNISSVDTDDFINNIKQIEEDSILLSKKGILLDGIVPNNVIISDKIYITDPSNYSFIGKEYVDGLIELNSYQLHLLFTKMIILSLKRTDVTSVQLKEMKNTLLSKDTKLPISIFFSELLNGERNIKTYVKRL